MDAVDLLKNSLEEKENLLVVTGAGISVASGIPPFRRSSNAIWEKDVTEMATRSFFLADPVKSWLWYLQRFETVLKAQPNQAHIALVTLEQLYKAKNKNFMLVTQNIDALHRKAGSQNLIEIHGTVLKVRCSRDGCTLGSPKGYLLLEHVNLQRFKEQPSIDTIPRCPECESFIRPHVLWFDEYYQEHQDYGFDTAIQFAQKAEVYLFIGTSFSVGITDIFLKYAYLNSSDIYVIDPNGMPFHLTSFPKIVEIKEEAEKVIPSILDTLLKKGREGH